jgi:hypothetical protein
MLEACYSTHARAHTHICTHTQRKSFDYVNVEGTAKLAKIFQLNSSGLELGSPPGHCPKSLYSKLELILRRMFKYCR